MLGYLNKSINTWFIATSVIVITLGLCGCSTTSGVEATGKTAWDDEGARELRKKVIFNNGSLAGDIQIIDMQSTLAGDIMRAQATLKSKDRDTLRLQYRFEWYDAKGMEIVSSSGAWKPLIVYGKENKIVQGVAPDPRAKDFTLKIREPEE